MTELPTTFGKYYLTEKLATGGMAEIYLAKIIGPGGFEKPLVIKQIHPKLTGQRHFVDLFVAEAKTLVTLAHGNIVPVYELGVVDDTYFIAMEYIDGPTLYRLTEAMAQREGHMEPTLAAWITARILEGLDYAHRKGEGVIHRDLSPRNVMLSRDGEVKLVDFGIAVTLGDPGEGDASQSAPTGSFPYMSPEQVRRESLTGQSDLFSAGVLAWEMMVGRRLFARAEAEATLAAVLHEEIPRPSSVRPEIPAKLDEVVMRALERDRGARWSGAGEMLAALNRYLYSLDATPGPRDVAALVAKFCPPETRRLPTHAPEAVGDDGSGPANALGHTQPAPAGGPRTAVIPRDGSEPLGKRPQRHQTFATHVELKNMLERATPMHGVEAITDDPAPAPETKPTARPPEDAEPPSASRRNLRARSEKPDVVEPDEAPRPGIVAPPFGVPGRAPPSRALLIVVGLGGLALTGAAIYVFFEGREAVLRERDAGAGDATAAFPADAIAVIPAAADATAVVPADSSARDAAGPLPRIDAGHAPRDAEVRSRAPDAGLEIRPDAARPTGTATLQIGADPWGEIYIDDKPYGQTPRAITVPAGHHTVRVEFPAETPPRKQTFAIDLGAGETKPIQADFAH